MKWVKLWIPDKPYTMTIEQQGFWDRLLQLAGRCAENITPGFIGVSDEMGFVPQQLAHLLGVDVTTLGTISIYLQKENMVHCFPNGVMVVVNWKHYQGEYLRLADWRDKRRGKRDVSNETTPPDVSNETPKNQNQNQNHIKKNKEYIYTFWNLQPHLPHHQSIKAHEKGMEKALQGYNLEEIKQAIQNYNVVMGDNSTYWFSYRWSLGDFCSRGMLKFSQEARPLENFRQKKGGNSYGNNRQSLTIVGAAAPKPGKYAKQG